jgi:hypothetical protein
MSVSYETTLEIYEEMIEDAITAITCRQAITNNVDDEYKDDNNNEYNNEYKDEYELNFSNMVIYIITNFNACISGPNLMYGKWVIEVLVEYDNISLHNFMIKASSKQMITRGDFLGLYRRCISKLKQDSQQADKITVQLLIKNYHQNIAEYSGKPVEKILKNNDLFRLMTTFIHD